MAGSSSNFVFYHYRPSLSAAAVFVAIFGLSTLLHFYQFWRKRTMHMIPLAIGGTCEAVGYVGRVISHIEAPDYKLPAYILQSLLLLIAPAIMAASVYMVLGRIVTAVDGESRCPIKRKYLTITFVLGDITSFMTQSTGEAFQTERSELALHNQRKLLTSFHRRKSPRSSKAGLPSGRQMDYSRGTGNSADLFRRVYDSFFQILSLPLQIADASRPVSLGTVAQNPYTIFAASILIMVRSVFRVVEYIQGDDCYLLRREIWLYIFDATLMAAVMLLFNIIHPSKINAASKGQKHVLQEQTEEEVKNSPDDEFMQMQAQVAAAHGCV